jgi:hypothetical protein
MKIYDNKNDQWYEVDSINMPRIFWRKCLPYNKHAKCYWYAYNVSDDNRSSLVGPYIDRLTAVCKASLFFNNNTTIFCDSSNDLHKIAYKIKHCVSYILDAINYRLDSGL